MTWQTEHERNPHECLAALSIVTPDLGWIPCLGQGTCPSPCPLPGVVVYQHGTVESAWSAVDVTERAPRNALSLRKTSFSQE